MKFITLSKLSENLRSFFNNIIKPYVDKELAKPSSFTMTANQPEWWDNGEFSVPPEGTKLLWSTYGTSIIEKTADGTSTVGELFSSETEGSAMYVGEINGTIIIYPYGG